MMERDIDRRKKISSEVTKRLTHRGAPLPSFGQLAEGTASSRQLINYHFDEPTDLLLEVCDHLAEAYRMALVVGAQDIEGQARLRLILDFYFDLVESYPKPRDDQAYDAVMAYAAGSAKVRTALREQYTLLGLCCTNRMRDSSRESSVVAGLHEQTDTPDLQDQELARL